MTKTLLAAAMLAGYALSAQAAPFNPDDLVVYRVGTGSGALSSNSTAVFLDEYTKTGTLVQSIAMPTATAGASFALTASGTATSEGLLTRSADSSSLILTGYGVAPGTASIAGTTSAVATRVIGVVNAAGVANTTTGLGTAFSGNNIRSAVSTDGTQLWAAGATTGVVTTTLGTTTTPTIVSSTLTNNRQLEIFNGQLYSDTGSGTTLRLGTVGTGLPTTSGNAITSLSGLPTSGSSPYAFFMADLSGVPGLDTLYLADDGASTNAAGLYKYSFDGTTWSLKGSIATSGLRGLTGSVSNGVVSLFATSSAGTDGKLFSFSDATGSTGTLTGSLTQIATAGTNTAFRGLALAPVAAVPEPGTYAMLLAGLACVGFIARRRSV